MQALLRRAVKMDRKKLIRMHVGPLKKLDKEVKDRTEEAKAAYETSDRTPKLMKRGRASN